jgi:hypothetical protein
MYDAINETLFHWQSIMLMDQKTNKGLSYINHILRLIKNTFFIRRKANDEKGNTMGYVFIGEGVLKIPKVQNQ